MKEGGVSEEAESAAEEVFLRQSFIPEKYHPFKFLTGLVGDNAKPYVGAMMGLGAGVLMAQVLGGSREVVGLGVGGGLILGFIFGIKAQKKRWSYL